MAKAGADISWVAYDAYIVAETHSRLRGNPKLPPIIAEEEVEHETRRRINNDELEVMVDGKLVRRLPYASPYSLDVDRRHEIMLRPRQPIKAAEQPEPPTADQAEPVERPDETAVQAAMVEITKDYLPGTKPSQHEIWGKLKGRLGQGVTREMARDALKNYAPHLCGRRGYSSIKSPT